MAVKIKRYKGVPYYFRHLRQGWVAWVDDGGFQYTDGHDSWQAAEKDLQDQIDKGKIKCKRK